MKKQFGQRWLPTLDHWMCQNWSNISMLSGYGFHLNLVLGCIIQIQPCGLKILKWFFRFYGHVIFIFCTCPEQDMQCKVILYSTRVCCPTKQQTIADPSFLHKGRSQTRQKESSCTTHYLIFHYLDNHLKSRLPK